MCTGQCVKMLYLKCNIIKSSRAGWQEHIPTYFFFWCVCVSLQNLQSRKVAHPHNYESKVICPQQWPLEQFSRGHHHRRHRRVREIYLVHMLQNEPQKMKIQYIVGSYFYTNGWLIFTISYYDFCLQDDINYLTHFLISTLSFFILDFCLFTLCRWYVDRTILSLM